MFPSLDPGFLPRGRRLRHPPGSCRNAELRQSQDKTQPWEAKHTHGLAIRVCLRGRGHKTREDSQDRLLYTQTNLLHVGAFSFRARERLRHSQQGEIQERQTVQRPPAGGGCLMTTSRVGRMRLSCFGSAVGNRTQGEAWGEKDVLLCGLLFWALFISDNSQAGRQSGEAT